jgi:hypothetical protein
MLKVKRSKDSVAIDTVPLPENELNLPVRRGIVKKVANRYILQIGRRTKELPVGTFIKSKDVANLVGKQVIVVYSSRKLTEIVAIGTWPTPESPRIRKRLILCYLPVPDFLSRIDNQIRSIVLNKMLSGKVITPSFARYVRVTK